MSGRCTICQETFDPTEISALKCGHTFHLQCISQWLQSSHSCPVCRRATRRGSDIIEQLFFDYGEDSMVSVSQSPQASSKRVAELSKKVQFLETELSNTKKSMKTFEQNASKAEKDIHSLRARNRDLESAIKTLRTQMTALDDVEEKNEELAADNKRLQAELKKLRAIEKLVKETNENDDSAGTYEDCSAGALKTSLQIMKRKFNVLTGEKQAIANRNKALEREIAALKKEKDELYVQMKAVEETSSLRKKASTPSKNHRRPDNIDCVLSPIFDPEDSADDICRAFNLPFLKTTNMAVRANLIPKQSNETSDSEDTSTIHLRKRTVSKAVKSSATFGKRFDGFGGRAQALEAGTSKMSPQQSSRPNKRTKATSAGKPKRAKMPAVPYVDSDDTIVVLSD